VVFRVLISTTTDGEEMVLVRKHALRKGGLSKGIERCRHWKECLFPDSDSEDEGGGDFKNNAKKTTLEHIKLKQQEKAIRALSGLGTPLDGDVASDDDDDGNEEEDEEEPPVQEGQGEVKGADKFEFTLMMLLAMGKIEFKSLYDVEALIRERKEHLLLNKALKVVSDSPSSDLSLTGTDLKKSKLVDFQLIKKVSHVKMW
jgi:hypothetical protein